MTFARVFRVISRHSISSRARYTLKYGYYNGPRNERRFKSFEYKSTDLGPLGLRVVKSLKDKTHRDEYNLVLLEGWRLINDAFHAGGQPVAIYYSDKNLLDHLAFNPPQNALVSLGRGKIREITSTVTPQGIVAVFKKPHINEASNSMAKIPVTVICDGLKDPNNLGSIIRGCAAAGCQSILISRTSVDAWDPKVLRGGAGGHFRIPLVNNCSWDEISDIIPHDSNIYLADGAETNTAKGSLYPTSLYHEVDWTQRSSALVIGQESSGLSKEAKIFGIERRGQFISIPMSNGVDSLSAAMAASVILFEAARQNMIKKNDKGCIE